MVIKQPASMGYARAEPAPAKAWGGHPARASQSWLGIHRLWILAFAGMTAFGSVRCENTSP